MKNLADIEGVVLSMKSISELHSLRAACSRRINFLEVKKLAASLKTHEDCFRVFQESMSDVWDMNRVDALRASLMDRVSSSLKEEASGLLDEAFDEAGDASNYRDDLEHIDSGSPEYDELEEAYESSFKQAVYLFGRFWEKYIESVQSSSTKL